MYFQKHFRYLVREAICTSAFKQFIPNPLNSRSLSEPSDRVEEGAGNRERAGMAQQLGECGQSSPLPSSGVAAAGGPSPDDRCYHESLWDPWVFSWAVCFHCFHEHLHEAFTHETSEHSEYHGDACHHTTPWKLHLTCCVPASGSPALLTTLKPPGACSSPPLYLYLPYQT